MGAALCPTAGGVEGRLADALVALDVSAQAHRAGRHVPRPALAVHEIAPTPVLPSAACMLGAVNVRPFHRSSAVGADRAQQPTASVAFPSGSGECATPLPLMPCAGAVDGSWTLGQWAGWPCLRPPRAGRPARSGASGMAWRADARSTALQLGACSGICSASLAPPWGRTTPNRFGWLEAAHCPPGWGGRSAARTKGAWRKQGRSVVRAQLAGRMRARVCTVRTDTGGARVPKH